MDSDASGINETNETEPIKRERLFASVILDGVYLILWLTVQFGVNWVVQQIPPDDTLDQRVLVAIQVLFAISTLVVVLAFIINDVGIILIRVYKRLKEETKR